MNHFRRSKKSRHSSTSIMEENHENMYYNQQQQQRQSAPELYISSPLNGVPGTLNAVAAHVAALSHGMANASTPICPSVYSNDISLVSGFGAATEERALAIQARAVGTLVFLTNPYYGSTRCLKELQQCKANLSAAMILDEGLGVARESFDRSIYPFCDADSQKFTFWSRRAEQANSFMGGMQQLHCSNLDFSKFTCDKCLDNSKSVCTSCSDFNQHMHNPTFLSSVRSLAGVINELAPTLIQTALLVDLDRMIEPSEFKQEHQQAVSTPTGAVTDYSNQSVHSPSDADKKRLSATARNPIFDDVDDIDMEAYAQLQQQHNQQQANSTHRNSLSRGAHKLKAGISSFMSKTQSTSHHNGPLVQRDSGNDHMFFSAPVSAYYDDDDVTKEIGEMSALLMEEGDEGEPVVFMYSSEDRDGPRHPEAIAMLPKQQREKGTIYVVDGVRKKWDGRQWRRLCTIASGCSAASRGTTPFCVAHGRVPECKQPNCKNPPIAKSRRCAAHARKSSKSKKKESTTSSTLSSLTSSTWPSPIDGRCQFKTALGDLCGNSIADSRTAPLCTPCWCCVTGFEWKNDTAASTDVVGEAMSSMTLSL